MPPRRSVRIARASPQRGAAAAERAVTLTGGAHCVGNATLRELHPHYVGMQPAAMIALCAAAAGRLPGAAALELDLLE